MPYQAKKQSITAQSSAEAEYRAIASTCYEIAWLLALFKDMGLHSLTTVTLRCDNQATLYIVANRFFHERTKHIEIDCHFTRDKVMEGLIQLCYLPTQSQLADVLTKILPSQQHWTLLDKLGMLTQHSKLNGGCWKPPSQQQEKEKKQRQHER